MKIRKVNTQNSEVNIPRRSKNRRSEEIKPHNSSNKTFNENGGPKGPEPTRYGDWEQKGRCTDF